MKQHDAKILIIDDDEDILFAFRLLVQKHVTDINGERHNLVIMSLDIKDLWYLKFEKVKPNPNLGFIFING